MNNQEVRAALREARLQRDRTFTEIENARDLENSQERVASLNRDVSLLDGRIVEMEAELGRWVEVEAMARDDRHREAGTNVAPPPDTRARPTVTTDVDRALRTIERNESQMDAAASDRIDGLVRRADGRNIGARYIEAVGDENYRTAFGKMLADPTTGHLRFSGEEVEAVRKVSAIDAERAMGMLPTSSGGFALPLTLDPSIIMSGSGALNPIRNISRVISTVTNTWNGVSSDGVTASYVGEAVAASDGSPTLAQPTVVCAQWRTFVPFSIEIGQDWPGIDNELVNLVADAQLVNDATQFYSGNGTLAPRGVMTDLTASQRVATSGATAFAVSDPWLLKAGIPARFSATATFAAHPKTWDTAFRFVGGNSTEPLQFDSGRGGNFLGRPKVEWSAVGTQTTTTSSTLMVAGDFSKYTIVDRIGITAELIPHIFSGGTAIHYPSGQRGLYVYGRTGAAVTAVNAFRALVVG